MSASYKNSPVFPLVVLLGILFVSVFAVYYGNFKLSTQASQGEAYTQTLNFDGSVEWQPFSVVVNSGLTARDVCEKTQAEEISYWDNLTDKAVVGRDCSRLLGDETYYFLNYELKPYHGYFVHGHVTSSFTISGQKAVPSYDVDAEAIYMYSFPETISGKVTAQHICKRFSGGKNSLMVSVVWDLVGDTYETHYCSEPKVNDFALTSAKPYYFWVTNRPEKVPPQELMKGKGL